MYKNISDKGMYYYFRREVKNHTLSSGTSPYRPCKGLPPELDENLWKCGEKYVKYPVTRKHPVRNPVNFAQPKFWQNFKI